MQKNKSTKFKTIETSKDQFTKLPLFKYLVAMLVIDVVLISLILLFGDKIPPEIPLFYGAPRGEEQLSTNTNLILPSLLSIAVIIINSSISLILENEFLKRVLTTSALAVNIMTIITTVKIILLVGGF